MALRSSARMWVRWAAVSARAAVGSPSRTAARIAACSAWSRGLVIDCGCFNPDPTETGTNILATMGRDVFYIAITLFMIYRPFKKWAIYP